MKAMPRYVLLQLVGATLAVTVVLTLVVLLLPTFLGVALPITTFCAVLFVYNKLTMDSEMVVMRAAGLSQLQLAMPALLVALGGTAAGFYLFLWGPRLPFALPRGRKAAIP